VPDHGELELFARARSGDRAAFDRLRARLEPRVRRFVRRLVGQQSNEEEDILQDAFLALYLNRARVEPLENLLPFLFRIVRNRCYDELRRRGRFQWVPLDEPVTDGDATPLALTDGRPPPDEVAHWMLVLAEVQQGMDRLPELQRQTLILLCEEGLTYEQIAAAMGTDLGTVKSRVHYARKQLQKLLRPGLLQSLGLQEKGHANGHCRRTDRGADQRHS
jgi:RNA polymerase sigma-70 factor (ECF subfamily)